MGKHDFSFDSESAIDRLLRFLAIEGITGQEKAIAQAVIHDLIDAGIPRRAIQFDDVAARIPLPTETGNVIVNLAGTRAGPRRLFMTHLDTVPLCAGVKPVRRGQRIVAAGKTALGGDNRTGVACLVTMAATLRRAALTPSAVDTALHGSRGERALGARFVEQRLLESPVECFNVDGRSAAEITIGAVGAERWEVEVHGKAAHAGVYPEQGISATIVAAIALGDAYKAGWFGKVSRDGRQGTSNVGVFGGAEGQGAGNATNVVTDYALIRGESRSHDSKFVREITQAYRSAFTTAAKNVRNTAGRQAKVRFRSRRDYYPFRLKEKTPVVQHALAAARSAGFEPRLKISNGGLDANWLVRHGIPTITFGAGQHNIHSVGEYVDLAEYEDGCRMALALATLPD